MKNSILILACLIFAGSFSMKAFAQFKANNSEGSKNLEISLSFGNPTEINAGADNLNDIHVKAVRDFGKHYRDANDAKWYVVKNGFIARFKSEEKSHMVAYDQKGKWMFTISQYDEFKLPSDVRATVKSEFYDYSITLVEEVQTLGRSFYIVHMQDEKTWKNVKIEDGNMDIVEDFNKD
ncbi:MAG: hypothetical protein C5B59_04645 [Bacteroidetes bacterium]|nr:MAG: hypothetical protein C5B59_04645 [Bacteroidota bacterium]